MGFFDVDVGLPSNIAQLCGKRLFAEKLRQRDPQDDEPSSLSPVQAFIRKGQAAIDRARSAGKI